MITEKQITAVWNMVIILKLEYQLQEVLLSKRECEKLMTPILKLCKHKGNFPMTLPNYIVYDRGLIGLKNLFELQLEMISKKLIYYANDKGILGRLFKIQMINLQLKYWTCKCLGDSANLVI